MKTQSEWSVRKLESGEKVTALFDSNLLEDIRESLEAKYKSWPISIYLKEGMMDLTPTGEFIKK